MRTTVNLDPSLLERAKLRAAERRETLGDVINDALRRELAVQHQARSALEPLPIFHGTGLRDDVDISSNAKLAELLDEGLPWEKLR